MKNIQDVREAAILQAEDSLSIFQSKLEALGLQILETQEADELVELLRDNERALVALYLEKADAFLPKNEKEEEKKSMEGYIWNYFFSEKFKNLSLLIRDTLLQVCISQQTLAEKRIGKEKAQNHLESCKALLNEAIAVTCRELAGEIQVLKSKEGALERKFETILHLKNPWKIYREQYTTILKQIEEILSADDLIQETIMTFTLIRSNLERMGFDIKKQNHVFLQKTQECQKLFENLERSNHIDETLQWMEAILEELLKFEGKQEHQVRILEGWLESLKSFTVPVNSRGGLLVTKQVDFKKVTTKWLDYFILPDIIELWEDQETIISRIKHVISQVRGSLSIAKKAESPANFNSDRNAIQLLLDGIRENARRATGLLIHIDQTIRSDFWVTTVYADQEFLKVPLQTSFTSLRPKNHPLGQWLQRTVGSLLSSIDKKYKETREKTPHQELELALQVIENRTHPDHPDHYHALFLTKNFVGDLFLVPRTEIENKLEEIVQQWRAGKSRSILIGGAPLCGKSTMAEHLSKVDFPKQTILLTPNSELSVEGRKFKTTQDLKAALDFVRKAIHTSSPLVLIDDLQLWRSREHSLLSNVQALLDFISTHGDRSLILATLPDILVKHLDSRLSFSSSFTHYFDLNQSSTDQIYRAIMLRHGASHKVLFHQHEEEPFTEREIQKKIQTLCKKFEYNLGAVLQAWTFCTRVFEGERVQFVEKNIELNDFFTAEEVLLVKHILLFGYGTDLEFKTFFKDRFEVEIRPAIRRLLNIHILGRNEAGQLVLQDGVKQDVYSLLKYKEIFN